MKKLAGVYETQLKNGKKSYRSSITYRMKHISLGSFSHADDAHNAYLQADQILSDKKTYDFQTLDQWFHDGDSYLSLDKIIVLLNFRDNGIYFHSPIYLRSNYFYYYIDQTLRFTFDKDDLFYYASHKIMKRGGHYFVSDYGMQVTIHSRYGIKNFAVKNRDYRFINHDETDFRYANIEIINRYHGVFREGSYGNYKYRTKIHINGDMQIGLFEDAETAAIAYNKAADYCREHGMTKAFPVNYIEGYSPMRYAQIYAEVTLPSRFTDKIDHLFA